MVKMFKFFNSDEMMAVATPEFDEIKYTEITRVQLNEFKGKLYDEYDFSRQLQFGNLDKDTRKIVVKEFLKDIALSDLEKFLNG